MNSNQQKNRKQFQKKSKQRDRNAVIKKEKNKNGKEERKMGDSKTKVIQRLTVEPRNRKGN